MTATQLRAWWTEQPQWLQRVLKTTIGVVVFIGVLTVTYHTVMLRFEGTSPTMAHSLQVVVETVTGTGYGSDAPWTTPVANALVTLMDLSTFLVLFIVFPYVFQPVLETALSPSLPATVEANEHVVICGTPRLTEQLIDDLASRGIDCVVITDNESDALALQDDGVTAICGSPTSADSLRRANVAQARTVVVDTGDERAASVVLATRQVNPHVRTIAIVDHLDHEGQLVHAGADRVLTPRQLLGRRIAERVGRLLDTERSDMVKLGNDFALLEMTVRPESQLADRRVDDIEAGPLSVVGHWKNGAFVGRPADDTVIEPGTVLLLGGPNEPLAAVEADGCPSRADPTVLLAGHGIVGTTVSKELANENIDCRVIDTEEGPGVDVVGDATTVETLRRAGITDAAAYIVALDDDDATVLSILAADEAGGPADSIARMNEPENESNIRRAGTAYVLGVPTISGRLLVSEVLQEPVVGVDRQIRTARVDGDAFVGRSLGEPLSVKTDCVVVGIERNDTLYTDFNQEMSVQRDDELLVVGSDVDIGGLS